MGLFVDEKKKIKLYGIGEKSVPAYPGKIVIKLDGFEIEARAYFIDAEDSTLLLGRLDIFDKFNICFNSSKQRVTFNPIRSY